jgi:hypothetical protein
MSPPTWSWRKLPEMTAATSLDGAPGHALRGRRAGWHAFLVMCLVAGPTRASHILQDVLSVEETIALGSATG